MANNTINNDIDPRLEQLLKDELTNRAKKIEAMKQWQHTGQGRLKILYGTVSGMAAVLVFGFFLMHNGGLYDEGCGSALTEEPVYRGALVDPSIFDAIYVGDTTQAILLIDSALRACNTKLQELDSIEFSPENQEEYDDTRLHIQQEINELKELEKSIEK